MARRTRLTGADLQREYERIRRNIGAATYNVALDVAEDAVIYQTTEGLKSMIASTYSTSAAQLFASALADVAARSDEATQNLIIKAVRAVEGATIGVTEVQQRDNAEINAIFARFAETINDTILENYIAKFGGHSYRDGDPARKSGELERFLAEGKLAKAEGMGITVSLKPAVNDADVPHIFRLNYGTKSLVGREKTGVRAPTFKVSLVPGARARSRVLSGARRPGFYFPGRLGGASFSYHLNTAAGVVQLHRASGGPGTSIAQRPSQGIAPSYFIEQGVTEAADQLPLEVKALIRRWKQRVARMG